jgi:hypothetical protein
MHVGMYMCMHVGIYMCMPEGLIPVVCLKGYNCNKALRHTSATKAHSAPSGKVLRASFRYLRDSTSI